MGECSHYNAGALSFDSLISGHDFCIPSFIPQTIIRQRFSSYHRFSVSGVRHALKEVYRWKPARNNPERRFPDDKVHWKTQAHPPRWASRYWRTT
jgi:hypothetical protein